MAKNKNRAIKYIKASGSPEPGTDLAEIIGAARDITERRQAEDAFRESESKYRTLFESSTDAIMTLDENSFIDCNTATLKMFACNQKSEFTMLHPGDISPPNQPDGTDSRAAADLRMAEAFEKGSSRFEWIHRTRNGQDFLAEVLLSALKLGGKQVLQATVRDITERRQGEEALKESEQRFKAIFDNAVDGIVLADLESKKFYTCNKMFSQMSGYSLEEIKNLGIVDIHPEKDLPYVTQQFEKQVAGEITLAEDIPVKRKDSSIFYADVNSSVITVSSKSYMMGIFRDTTERKKAREELRRSEEYFRALMENSLDAVTIINEDGTIRYESPSYERLLGFKPEDKVGSNLFERINPDDVTRVAELFAELLQNRGGTIHAEVRAQHKDGSWRSIEATGSNLLDNPFVKGVVVNLRDITERKRMEEKLLRLSDAVRMSKDSIVISDLEGRIVEANEATLKMHGMDNKADFVGKTALEIIAPEDREIMAEKVVKALAEGELKYVEYHALKKDGSKFLVEASISVMKDGKGEPTGYMAVTRDITERRKVEEALKQSEKRYRQLVENMQEGLWLIDKDSITTFVNPGMAEILGYTAEEMLGKHLFEFTDERGIQVAKDNLERRKPSINEQHDFEFIRKDGARVYVSMETSPITDEAGNYVGALACVADITERKRAEEALSKQSHDLSERVKELGCISAISEVASLVYR